MGNPLHFSLELPQRCLQLIEELWPHVEKTRQREHPELGSLSTTFLVSMSMPMINLPIERIERNQGATNGYADDRDISPPLASAIKTILGKGRLDKSPFYVHGAWSFASHQPFNIAAGIPDDLAKELSSETAVTQAGQMLTSQWSSILRNAMAHGGIAYLNEHGRSTVGEPIKMLAFVSGKYERKSETLLALNVLRIGEKNYRDFLRKWVEWLKRCEQA